MNVWNLGLTIFGFLVSFSDPVSVDFLLLLLALFFNGTMNWRTREDQKLVKADGRLPPAIWFWWFGECTRVHM
jgi:hypothetical protein